MVKALYWLEGRSKRAALIPLLAAMCHQYVMIKQNLIPHGSAAFQVCRLKPKTAVHS